MAAWFEKVETVLSELDVHSEQGLSTDVANKRQALHGKNEVEDGPEASLFRLVLKQFEDLMVIILLVAAFVSFLLALLEESKNDRLTAFVEPVVILVILFMNALFGVIQERDAERAIQSLKSFEATTATVLRDNKLQIINGIDLVPGDILQLVAGDKVPADARILEVSTSCFATDQAILTGEVESCFKHAEALARGEAVVNQDKTNMVFSGTLVIKGKCRAVVTAIGTATEMGMIQSELGQISTGQSPLKEKLDEFGERLSKLIAIVCISVWLINIQHFGDPVHGGILRGAVYYFKIAVALAVAAVPEGLPAVVTSCLALGTRIMTKNGAIVRSLPSVETLGCTTVICVDKTGTITSNEMVAQRIITFDENDQAVLHSVTGAGYEPHGFVTSSGYLSTYSIPLEEVSKIITLCNDAEIRLGPEQHTYSRIGEPTECALRVLAAKLNNLRLGQNSHPENEIFDYWKALLHRVSTNEFTRERMLMSVVSFDPQMSQYSVFAKGAPESILRRCTRYVSGNGEIRKLTETVHTVLMEQLRNLSKEAFRVIAVAKREVDEMEIVRTDPESLVQLEQDLSFVGFVGICDPPRASVSNAIEKCYQAGMRIIVLTGDSSDTAQAVCRSVGILDSDENTPEVGTVVTGSDWMGMTEKEQRDCATSVKVLARIEPMHKLKLVQYLQDAGEVVAMTGDGVNDAPALKQADIGISMGSGTSVAKEASDIVLIHNDFSTIITAVEQGRTIFANTKQFIRYLVSSNIGEVACIFLAAALGIPEGLIPVQLLWVNLVTDGLPAIALGFNKPDATVMQRKPRSKSDGIVNNWLTVRFLVIGLYVGVAVVVGFVWWFMFYESGPKLNWHELQSFESCDPHTSKAYSCDIFKWTSDGKMRYPSTVALSILVVIEMLNALNSLSEDESLLTVTPASNPWLIASIITSLVLHGLILYIPFFANIFNVAPLSLVEWTAVIWFSAPVIIVDETMKYLSRNTVSHINNGKLIQNSWLRIDRSDKLV